MSPLTCTFYSVKDGLMAKTYLEHPRNTAERCLTAVLGPEHPSEPGHECHVGAAWPKPQELHFVLKGGTEREEWCSQVTDTLITQSKADAASFPRCKGLREG